MRQYVEVHVPGLGSERHELVGEALTLGTGSGASVRTDQRAALRSRHLDLNVKTNGVSVALSPGVETTFVFEGAERARAFVPWGEELFLGNVRLMFLETPEAERPSSVLLGFAPIALLIIGFSVFKAVGRDQPSGRSVEAPILFAAQVPCPERDPLIADHRAREAERAARAKAERFAFAFHDGVAAGRLFQESRACFESLGLANEVARLDDETRRWLERVNGEYAAARLRLRVSLDHKRYADALSATKELRALLTGREREPYTEWLIDLERELAQTAGTP